MARRKTWQTLWRLGLCGVLLAWAFHGIFLNESQQEFRRSGRDWEALGPWAQWQFAWSYGPAALLRVLALIRPFEGALSLIFMGLTLLFGTLRWRIVLRGQEVRVPLGRVFEISLVAHFFNAFLLGSTGGDLAKAYYAAGETRDHKAESVASVVVDRLIGLGSMLLFAVVMMLPNGALLRQSHRLAFLALIALVMLLALALVGGLSLRGGLSRWWPGARDWLRRLPKGESLERALVSMRRYGREPRLLLEAAGLSMFLNVACVLQFWALARGLGLAIDTRVLFLIVPIIICVSALPITPNGLGVRENLYVLVLATPQIAIPATQALSLSLLAYAGSLFWSLVGGLVYLQFRRAHPWREPAAGAADGR